MLLLSKAYIPPGVFGRVVAGDAIYFVLGTSLLFILVSTYKLARSQFSLSTSVYCV